MSLTTVLAAMLAFQVKHFLCDFVLQTRFQVDTKKIYGHYGGFIHAGLHAVFSVPALLILSASPAAIGLIVVGEFVLHYHVDWLKGWIDTRTGWTEADNGYWMVFGADQLIHQLTYTGIIAFLCGVI